MRSRHVLPFMAIGLCSLLVLPAVSRAGQKDALVDGPRATAGMPASAKAAFDKGEAEFRAWSAGGSQRLDLIDMPFKQLKTTSHKQIRNDFCGPATTSIIDHYLRGASRHWSQQRWAKYRYNGQPLWTDADGARMWVIAMGLRRVTKKPYVYSKGVSVSGVFRRTKYGIDHDRPLAYGVRIVGTAWPYYKINHLGHIICGRGYDGRRTQIHIDDPYPENAPPPLGYDSRGGNTYGKRTYPAFVVARGVTASFSKQVVY